MNEFLAKVKELSSPEVKGQRHDPIVPAHSLSRRLRVLCSVLLILILVGTRGKPLIAVWDFIMEFEEPGRPSADVALDCEQKVNRRTPYCVRRRMDLQDSWESITRYTDGKTPQFTLYDNR